MRRGTYYNDSFLIVSTTNGSDLWMSIHPTTVLSSTISKREIMPKQTNKPRHHNHTHTHGQGKSSQTHTPLHLHTRQFSVFAVVSDHLFLFLLVPDDIVPLSNGWMCDTILLRTTLFTLSLLSPFFWLCLGSSRLILLYYSTYC